MRTFTVLAGLCVLACSQVAFSGEAANKPIVVADATVKHAPAPKAHPAAVLVTASRVTRETSVPQGSLEGFGSVGLPR